MKFAAVPVQLVVVVLPLTLVIMGDSLMYVVLPTAAADFGITRTLGLSASFWVGLALSINRFVRLISNAIAARVYERNGLKWPFVLAVTLGALTTLTYALTSGIVLLLIARTLWGISYSFMRLASQIVVFQFGSPTARGRYLGFFNAGQRLGSLFAVTVGAAIVALTSPQTTFAVLAAIGVIGILIALRAPSISVPSLRSAAASGSEPGLDTKPGPQNGQRTRSRISAIGSALSPAPSVLQRDVRNAVGALSLMRFSVAFASNGLAIATVAPYLVELLSDDRRAFGLPIAAVVLGGLLVGFRWFSDLALSIPLGQFSDRIGRTRSITGGVVIMIGVLVLVGVLDSPELFVLAIPWLFITSVLATTSMDAAAGELVPDNARASVMAKYANWQDLGGAIGPLVGLVVADALGFQTGYLIAAALLVATLIPLRIAARRVVKPT